MASSKKLKRGATLVVTIDAIDSHGRGIGKSSGKKILVRGAVPGETVRVQLGKFKSGAWLSNPLEIVEPDPSRIVAECPAYGTCGGCAWQDLPVERQLSYKHDLVRQALADADIHDIEPAPVISAPNPFRYRNKVELSFGTDEEGKAVIGFNEWGRWDKVCGIQDCPIGPEKLGDIIPAILGWAHKHDIPAYNPKQGRGFLRYLVVRASATTGQVIVNLVTTPANRDWPKQDLLERLEPLGLHGILWTEHGTPTQAVFLDDSKILMGNDWLEESIPRFGANDLPPLLLRYSHRSFYQPNPLGAANMFAWAAKNVALGPETKLLDFCCGVGTIGLALASSVGRVAGIESVTAAVTDARHNAEVNGISNTEFVCADAETIAWSDLPFEPDVVVLDPPRGGLHPRVVRRIREHQPPIVLYVSCNPRALATDLGMLKRSYEIRALQPFDLFPHTEHVEVVAVLASRPLSSA